MILRSLKYTVDQFNGGGSICISGYAEETFRNRLGEGQDIHFLPKPFSLAQLAGKVKEVMDRVAV